MSFRLSASVCLAASNPMGALVGGYSLRCGSIAEQHGGTCSHFIGAIVLEQVPTHAGAMDIRLVIDGQQRLTTSNT